MNKIPRSKTKSIVIPQQPYYLKVNKKDKLNDKNFARKISQKIIKLNTSNRQFGNDITINVKNNNKEEYQTIKPNHIKSNKVNQIYIFLILFL